MGNLGICGKVTILGERVGNIPNLTYKPKGLGLAVMKLKLVGSQSALAARRPLPMIMCKRLLISPTWSIRKPDRPGRAHQKKCRSYFLLADHVAIRKTDVQADAVATVAPMVGRDGRPRRSAATLADVGARAHAHARARARAMRCAHIGRKSATIGRCSTRASPSGTSRKKKNISTI
jgi:hypothetical protein